MNGSNFRWIVQALLTISGQVHSCETKLNVLLERGGHDIDPQLIQVVKKLSADAGTLQASVDAQQKPKTEGK